MEWHWTLDVVQRNPPAFMEPFPSTMTAHPCVTGRPFLSGPLRSVPRALFCISLALCSVSLCRACHRFASSARSISPDCVWIGTVFRMHFQRPAPPMNCTAVCEWGNTMGEIPRKHSAPPMCHTCLHHVWWRAPSSLHGLGMTACEACSAGRVVDTTAAAVCNGEHFVICSTLPPPWHASNEGYHYS